MRWNANMFGRYQPGFMAVIWMPAQGDFQSAVNELEPPASFHTGILRGVITTPRSLHQHRSALPGYQRAPELHHLKSALLTAGSSLLAPACHWPGSERCIQVVPVRNIPMVRQAQYSSTDLNLSTVFGNFLRGCYH